MGDLFGVLLTLILLAGNAFYVAAEFALISARRDRLEILAAQGKRGAHTVIRAGEHLSMMLAAAQLGVTICSLLLGRIGEPAVAHLLQRPFDLAGLPDQLLHPVSFALSLAIVVMLHMLLGEMIPKNIALAGPERVALLLVPIMLAWLRLARPLIVFYNKAANLSLRALRIEPKDELDATVSSVELAEMIGESRSQGLLDEEEHRRLTQALGTTDRIVADVMVPLAKTRSVPLRGDGTTLGDIENAVAETGFSRYPVRAHDGSLVGYLHVKDVLDKVADDAAGPSTPIPRTDIRPLPTVSMGTTLYEALARQRRTNSHLGRVIDSRGNTVGIVALEDLVEEFVGTVRDATHRIAE
ncbi:HlyC/CorC family transporter [Nocardia terpenica]|uniref:hemolysin family protein n=1 Tax=Nocardia terpenica TaxID=455432 RepID=UPI00189618A0|nr:hemolysin family protein [Nocardia terpenica]MBF6064311.1 HlyC/CorC family transporter [Nocardia terpenica]MBF6106644.1 HlyC/CorC family transporter [Nocardia terpenica]MBF6113929.1 HlyC/CorC family transporter [Nocardia terpenica]MBF6120447.1 HlyC/CorC family transporter [Nocardia terpenica]MBF6154896.1 HlyC/CorC family transporter [Nocardia terpenica]